MSEETQDPFDVIKALADDLNRDEGLRATLGAARNSPSGEVSPNKASQLVRDVYDFLSASDVHTIEERDFLLAKLDDALEISDDASTRALRQEIANMTF